MNVIITGTSRGIGLELVHLFCSDKMNKVIGLSRNFDKMISDKDQFGYKNYYPFYFDFEEDNYEQLIQEINNVLSTVDILINNAGLVINKSFLDFSTFERDRVVKVNYTGPAELIKQLIPFLQKSKNPHIVNISSMGGFQGSSKFAGLSYYSSSKAAICNLTECLAEEFKNSNIKINCLALGAVQTEMLEEAFPGYKAPLKAEEMAKYIYDFAINARYYMNGKIIPVSLSTP